MSSDDDDKKELYEFDTSYLKRLNKIREQLNLEPLSEKEASDEDDNVSIPSSKTIPTDEELYKIDDNYLEDLNAIRKELSLVEISESGQCEITSVKEEPESSKIVDEDLSWYYVPPKKKRRIEEKHYSSDSASPSTNFQETQTETVQFSPEPSEQSSPVKTKENNLVKTFNITENSESKKQDHHPFASQTVPKTVLTIKPTVRVLREDDHQLKIQELSDKQEVEEYRPWLMTGLDLPKKSKELYNFPSVVHLANWATVLDQEVKVVDNILTDSKTKPKKKLTFGIVNEKEMFPELLDAELKHDEIAEAEICSSLNNMHQIEEKIEREIAVSESTDTSFEDESGNDLVKRFCRCFNICFAKRPKTYFD